MTDLYYRMVEDGRALMDMDLRDYFRKGQRVLVGTSIDDAAMKKHYESKHGGKVIDVHRWTVTVMHDKDLPESREWPESFDRMDFMNKKILASH